MSTASKKSNSGSDKRPAPTGNDELSTHSPAACLDCRNRKVKCNRELPKCSNCKRSGVPCRFPNPEKKASQMKQLSEDVAQFNGRLSVIEKSLVNRMQELTELVTQSIQDRPSKSSRTSRTSTHISTPQTSSEIDDSDVEDDSLTDEFDNQRLPIDFGIGDRPSSVIVANGPGERFYGPCSTYSHMVHSRGLVEKLLNAGEQPSSAQMSRRSSSNASVADNSIRSGGSGVAPGTPLFTEVRRRYDSFSGPANFQENFDLGDDRPLELPPRQVLEEAIENYTSGYSLEPPLFYKQTLADAIAKQYSVSQSDVDESWVLCFNNIILRSSGWKSRAFRFNSFAASSIDTNVLHLLLGNANRALRQLEKFCALRLVNIQALLLLAFVGRDFIHYNVFARIFDRVCQLAKQMGLHEREVVIENGSIEDREAQNVLWTLYSVDKQSIFIRGPPCRIYEFECHLRLPPAETVAQKLVSANLRLNCLIEEVYRHLYSPKATKLDATVRQRRVERLDGRLLSLDRQVENLTNSADNGFVENVMRLHLKYAFNVTRLLILSQSGQKQSKQIRQEVARSALQTIQSLPDGGFAFDGSVIVLEMLFCNYSVIAFHEIFESLITDVTCTNTTADLELLKSTTRTLKMILQPDRPYSYCTRLHKNFVWCTEIASLVSDARRPATPASRLSGSPSTDSNHQVSRQYSNSIQQRPTPPPTQYSSNRATPPQELNNDILMEDAVYGSSDINATATLNAMWPSVGANDFAGLQSALNPQGYMFTGGDDFGMSGPVMSNQFVPPQAELSPGMENSARFRESLKYALSMGGGFDGSIDGIFQQTNNDRTPTVHCGRCITKTSNREEAGR